MKLDEIIYLTFESSFTDEICIICLQLYNWLQIVGLVRDWQP